MPRFASAFATLVLLAIAQLLEGVLPEVASSLALAGLLLATVALPALLVAILLRRRRGGSAASPRVRAIAERLSVLGPLAGFVALLASGWEGTPERWVPPEAPGLAALITLAPLLAGWALAVAPRLADDRRRGSGESVRRGILRELRPVALVFTAVVLLRALSDLGWVFPRLREALTQDPLLSLAGVIALIGGIVLVSPFAVRWLHPAHPLPEGALRARLDRLAATAGVSLRQVWVWETGPRPTINACVSGVVPAHRSVFLTDGLLEHLDDDEVEGVFAHELAHGTRHHLWVYTALVIGFAGLAVGAMHGVDILGLPLDAATAGIILLALALFFIRFFGRLSRHFESQADLESAARTGSPYGIISALGKIGRLTGTTHRRGWRHPPIPTRIATVLACWGDERRQGEFRRRTRRYLGATAILVLLGIIGWGGDLRGRLSAPEWERTLDRAAYIIAAEDERAERPGHATRERNAALERAVILLRSALEDLPEDAEETAVHRRRAFGLLATAYEGLGDLYSAAAARFIARQGLRPGTTGPAVGE